MTNVTRKCKHCQLDFSARLADIKRGWAKFCSKSCKAKNQAGMKGQFAKKFARNQRQESYGNGEVGGSVIRVDWDGTELFFCGNFSNEE